MSKQLQGMCYDFLYENEQLRFFDAANNVYTKMNLENGECKIESFLEFDEIINRKFSSIARYNDRIIFAPGTERYVLIYNELDKSIKKIYLDESKFNNEGNMYRFCEIVIWEDEIYLFPYSSIPIVVINIKTTKIKYIDGWYREAGLEFGKYSTSGLGYRIDEKCYFPLYSVNMVMCFKLGIKEWEFHEIPGCDGGFWSMAYDNGEIWLSQKAKSNIFKWEPIKNEVEKICLDEEIYRDMGAKKIFVAGEYILLCPFKNNEIWYLNKYTKRLIKNIVMPEGEIRFNYFSCIKKVNDRYLVGFSPDVKKLLKICIETREVREYDTFYTENDTIQLKDRWYTNCISEKEYYVENHTIDLEFLFGKVKLNDRIDVNTENNKDDCNKYLFV